MRWLGRKAELPNLLRGVARAAARGARRVGQRRQRGAPGARAARSRTRGAELETAELDARLAADRVDVTLPGDAAAAASAACTCITQTRREIEDVFLGLGFTVARGPRGRDRPLQLRRAQHAPTHPARSPVRDTFYTTDGARPAHAHLADAGPRDGGPAAAALRRHPGPDVPAATIDATHTPKFHQVEGLAVDEDITLADLKGTLLAFARAIFGAEREVRLRPHFFPFTEPSVEVDVSCFRCGGTGWLADGSRCPVCKGEGWLEILGAGDGRPERLRLRATGYDPERMQGFAFGMGIERIAMLKHGIPTCGCFYDNDVRFLEQFG